MAAQARRQAAESRERVEKERQKVADELLEGLNPPQRAAVEHRGAPLLVVAGAGSGKTRVLTRRIAYLLAAGGAHPGEILAITFTNKAAAEMRERVAEMIGARSRAMWVSTFHSMCVRILRAEAVHIGVRSSFTIYDSADSQRLVQMVASDLNIDTKKVSARTLAGAISNLKNELIDPASAVERADSDSGQDGGGGLHRIPDPAAGGVGIRFRRSDHGDRRPAAGLSRRSPSITAGVSGTYWWTNTRTPTTPSTCWSANWSAAPTR